MEGSALTLVANVGQLVGGEYKQLSGVRAEVAELRDELATMNALLRMQSEADDGAVDHFVREWMKQVGELACDTEDCVDLYMFRVRCLLSDGFLLRLKRQLATLSLRRRLAGDIRTLRARAVAISERHARYGVNREALSRSAYLQLPAPVVSAMALSVHALRPANDPGQFVGMEEQVHALAEMVKAVDDVVGSEPGKKQLKVFSVVGFGGLGKTTLAMEVCRRLEADFQRQANVSVSQAFAGSRDLRTLLKRVLQQIVKTKADSRKGIEEEEAVNRIDDMGVDELAALLHESLKDNRYLIVIDDVWTIGAWDAIQSKLPDNNCGSRIIVTTQIETVARACSSAGVSGDFIYKIKPLCFENSKKLFLSRAFGSMDAICPEELKNAMASILKKCGGLPLAIVSIASLLASHRSPESKEMWLKISKSIGSQMESNPTLEGMRHVLTLSYNHLHHYLKGCAMYLSIFPEDYVTRKDRLVNRWIAERLVAEQRGLTLHEVAEAYYDELISRNIIEPANIILDGAGATLEACRVHDMMLEVMVSKCLDTNFVSLVGPQQEATSYDRIRRLSVHGGQQRVPEDSSFGKMAVGCGSMNGINQMNMQHVRSLTVFQLEGQNQQLLDRLGEFTLLRVLDLEDCEGLQNKHLGDICRLYLLRFLSIKGTDISVMTQRVGDLENLQTLDVRDTKLKDLPSTVTKLEKLERMLFRHRHEWNTMWVLPRELGRMKALRDLEGTLLRNDVLVAREIGELDQLQEISIYVDGSETNVLEELGRSLSKLYSLRALFIGDRDLTSRRLNFLRHLRSPPRLLRYFRMEGSIDELPSWFGLLTNLVEFEISWAELAGDQLFGVLCELPNLRTMTLLQRWHVDTELVARTTHKFPALTILKVQYCVELPRVIRFEEGSMTKLETLSVKFADRERSIVGIEHLKNLKEVKLNGNKHNPAMEHTLRQLKAEGDGRPEAKQFKVSVRYE